MRILILTAATGGGHDMRADALTCWVGRLSGWNTQICRPLEQGHALYRFGVGLYNWIQRIAPRLHQPYFGFLEIAGMHRNPKRILGGERFISRLAAFRPDIIVSTHAHLNHGFFDLAREYLGQSKVRCVTYCGELGGGYGFSRHWVNPDADLFIGAVNETVNAAIALGMPEHRSWCGGFMLFPEFYEDDHDGGWKRQFVRGQLEMDPDEFILLLAVGTMGANNHLEILKSLERRGKAIQVVVLCGNDGRAYDAVVSWACGASAVRLKALRYRNDMSRILRSASAVVSRPGTGTISEAIMSDCPLILNGIGGIMPQESVTVRYAEHYGIGKLIRHADGVAEILDKWEEYPHALQTLRRNLRMQRPSGHPRDVLEHLVDGHAIGIKQDVAVWQIEQGLR